MPESVGRARALHNELATDDPRFLSREACDALTRRVIGYTHGGGLTRVQIFSEWTGELRWARNRVNAASDRRTTELEITRELQHVQAVATTNQTDPHSLAAAVENAETRLGLARPSGDRTVDAAPVFQYPTPTIWNDATSAQPAATRTELLQSVLGLTTAQGMVAAGYLGVTVGAHAHLHSNGVALYAPYTRTQYSITVRNPDGTGSGWAGGSSYDWAKFDPLALTRVALEKCVRSQNPVRVEPGRYTTILEPQATYDLVSFIMQALRSRWGNEEMSPYGSYWDRPGYSKLGQRLLDERITLEHDPNDPALGVLPFDERNIDYTQLQPHRAVKWFDRGVLTALDDDSRNYLVTTRLEHSGYPSSGSVRMSGGTTTIDEMIATTKRGILVTRFSGMQTADMRSMLLTGYTRDGLWLVENGKITKTIKNFRFTESPLFAFNNVEQLGVPVPVFKPGIPVIVPPVKVRDFSFTSLADAV